MKRDRIHLCLLNLFLSALPDLEWPHHNHTLSLVFLSMSTSSVKNMFWILFQNTTWWIKCFLTFTSQHNRSRWPSGLVRLTKIGSSRDRHSQGPVLCQHLSCFFFFLDWRIKYHFLISYFDLSFVIHSFIHIVGLCTFVDVRREERRKKFLQV